MAEPNNQDYHHLLRRIAQGDHAAFAKLYDVFWPELLRHLLTKISDSQAAEDIIHDLFVSLWKRRSTILEIESIPAYLFTACRYMVFKYYKEQSLASPSELGMEEDFPLDERPLEERLYYRYLLDVIHKEVENLPDKCREIFKLSRYDYLSNKEIAQKLAISESTVENHINKAIKRLRVVSKNSHILFQLFF